MTIETLGDRRNSGYCLMCGSELLVPWNEYQCCSGCTTIIETVSQRESNRPLKKDGGGRLVIYSQNILRQKVKE